MKDVVVLIRRLPLRNLKSSEALRVSVGLTLRDNRITALFIDEGVWSTTELRPEGIKGPVFKKHIETLKLLGHTLVVDEDSLKERGIEKVREGIQVRSRPDILKIIDNAEVVIPF